MQPTQPGWYWDPKGIPGQFRWWDGEKWTDHVSVTRTVGPPTETPTPASSPDSRLHAAGLSCSEWPPPWTWCPDYPHLDDAIGQQVVVGRTPRGDYIGCVFIGLVPEEYLAGDLGAAGAAFSSAMLSIFYPYETPNEQPEPATGELDGHLTWQLVVPLDVEDDHLGFAREDAVFVLVDLGDRPAVLYASLPDVPDVAMPTADELIADLRLD